MTAFEIALTDFGEDWAGNPAPQIFLLDPRTGYREQITFQSRLPTPYAILGDPVIYFMSFENRRSIIFYSGVPFAKNLRTHRVKTDGRGVIEDIPAPYADPEGHIVAQFGVTGVRPQVILVNYDREASNGPTVDELFLLDGNRLLQLTNFGRFDTGFGYSSIASGRVFFSASANTGENPEEICQLFSADKFGLDVRQVTHFPSDGRPAFGCFKAFEGACLIDIPMYIPIEPDRLTGTLLFASSCDPVGGNPFGDQLFAMREDGMGLRQVTAARGREMLPDGTLRVEIVGPFAYPLGRL